MADFLPGEDDPEFTPITPIANAPVDSSAKLNELLAVLSLGAFLWNLFRDKKD